MGEPSFFCIDGECVDTPPECGDEAPECDSQFQENECEAIGGIWMYGDDYCLCLSGDADCPCWNFEHCQGPCQVDDGECYECYDSHVLGYCSTYVQIFETGCYYNQDGECEMTDWD